MNIRPLGDRVIVRRVEEETKTASGIYWPESATEKPGSHGSIHNPFKRADRCGKGYFERSEQSGTCGYSGVHRKNKHTERTGAKAGYFFKSGEISDSVRSGFSFGVPGRTFTFDESSGTSANLSSWIGEISKEDESSTMAGP
mgnify:CR=1 FL=1